MSLSCFEEKCFFIKEGSQQQVKCSPLGKSKHSSIRKVESLVAINLDFILFITTNKFQEAEQRGGVCRGYLRGRERGRSAGRTGRGLQVVISHNFSENSPFHHHFLYPLILFSLCSVGCISIDTNITRELCG